MPDIPDKVIEQATRAASRAQGGQEQFIHGFAPDDFEPWRWSSGGLVSPFKAGVLAAAPVIAAWAREQERDRIRTLIEGQADDANSAHESGRDRYELGRVNALDDLLAALDRDGSDTQEGK